MLRLSGRAVQVAVAALALAVTGWCAARPNIVLIVGDDLGYGDVGVYGASDIRTPNIDRLAAEGIRLTDFYAAPLCTPSRAQLLLGRYPVRSGLVRVLYPYSKDGIDEGEVTLAEALHDAGYTTHAIGKWHLGHLPQFLPTRHGFDTWLGIPYSNDMKPTPLMRADKVVEEPARQDSLTRRYTEEAVRIIREKHEGPFFLFLAHTMPHIPLAASSRTLGKSRRGLYGDVVEEMDWSTGEIMSALKKAGLDGNTLVIFTSDNGPWLEQGKNGGSAGRLRAGKETVYEGGIRVPFIARWPGHIPAGKVSATPAINVDLLPTLVKLAGGSVPGGVTVDGFDLMPLFTGTGGRASDEVFFYLDGQLRAMRFGKWKLIAPFRGKQKGKKGEVVQEAELYDLSADIAESNNLVEREPEVVKRLVARAREFDQAARRDAPPEKW